jgi:hypothetical protein
VRASSELKCGRDFSPAQEKIVLQSKASLPKPKHPDDGQDKVGEDVFLGASGLKKKTRMFDWTLNSVL